MRDDERKGGGRREEKTGRGGGGGPRDGGQRGNNGSRKVLSALTGRGEGSVGWEEQAGEQMAGDRV